jgi:hypothetical protein
MLFAPTEPDTKSRLEDLGPRAWSSTIDAIIHSDARLSSVVILWDPANTNDDLRQHSFEYLHEERSGTHTVAELDGGVTVDGF